MSALTDAGFGPQPTPNDPRIWKGTVTEFFEDAADRIDAKNLADAINAAIENPPKFYPGDRVKVRGRIEGQDKATVTSGPVTRFWFGKASETYLIALDHKTYQARDGIKQIEQWCSVLLLARLDTCPCGPDCKVSEGEAH